MSTTTITITDTLADSMVPAQLQMLAHDSGASHDARWKEMSEKKKWLITGHARQVSPDRIVVWSLSDEAGVGDVALVSGSDEEQAAANHAHEIAAGLDGRGSIGYVLAIVTQWERDSDTPRDVTDDTIGDRLREWIDGEGDPDTVQIATALYELI